MRCVIITPYYREPREWLQRCLDSVRNQTIATDHILVADGHAQDWIDGTGVRHLRLDRPHADCGNTPRAIGAMVGVAEHYDGIGFLDADNWLEPDHIESCLDTLRAAADPGDIDYVIARRHLRRPDGTIMPIQTRPVEELVDTNCFFFLAGAHYLLPYYGIMPKPLAPVGDRAFYNTLRSRGLKPAVNAKVTVNYLCTYQSFYLALGETPPPFAKPNVDVLAINAWMETLGPKERLRVQRLMGVVV